MKPSVAIYGYGNLGHGVETALAAAPDLEPVGIFTRRDPATLSSCTGVPVLPVSELRQWRERIDVLILCGGSATDLPRQSPSLAAAFNIVDSFDTHAAIPAHFDAVAQAASSAGHLALISAGWDPGILSLARLLFASVLPCGESATFWGRGVSQGHSDALRRIPGVLDAREYTVPLDSARTAARNGLLGDAAPTATHRRECYVVPAPDADHEEIVRRIREMPGYFAGYDTSVRFLTAEELARDHAALPHSGEVIRCGTTGTKRVHRHTLSVCLQLESNPEFTGGVLVAFARAVARMQQRGIHGCITPFDVPFADLSPLSGEELRKRYL